MGLTRWAEDARDLAAGVQFQNHSQLATEVATLIGSTELPLRERHRIEDLWTPVRSAQLAARSAQLQEERNHHENWKGPVPKVRESYPRAQRSVRGPERCDR